MKRIDHNSKLSMESSSVTVLGLGKMGSALASAFLKNGHTTTVWNRTADKANELVDKGALRAATVSEAVSASRLVVVCVLNYETMYEILASASDALSGRVLVNLTNGTPEQARQASKWAIELGAEYLDGGIMAIPPMISQPSALLLYSGSQSAFEARQQELSSLGTSMFLGVDSGLASLYDLALLSAMYGLFGGYFHSIALVGTEKVDAIAFTTLVVPWLTAMTTSLPHFAQAIDSGNHATDISNLDINKVALFNIIEASLKQGVSADLLTPIQSLINRGVTEGYGPDGLSTLVELIKKPASA